MSINARLFSAAAQVRCKVDAIVSVAANPSSAVRALRLRLERGDADSAGSTLRTIMVVAVVAAVVLIIGAAVRHAGSTAAACISSNGQSCPQ